MCYVADHLYGGQCPPLQLYQSHARIQVSKVENHNDLGDLSDVFAGVFRSIQNFSIEGIDELLTLLRNTSGRGFSRVSFSPTLQDNDGKQGRDFPG